MTISYTATTWTSGTTPASAPNMNNIEGGVVACVNALNTGYLPLSGGTMTGELDISRTLSGAQKIMEQFITSDGKSFQWIITTAGALVLYNVTDSVTVASFGPTSAITASVLHGAADSLASIFTAYYDSTFHTSVLVGNQYNGTAVSVLIPSWDGSSAHNCFSVGSGGFMAPCFIDDSGGVHTNSVAFSGFGIISSAAGNGIGFKSGTTKIAEMKSNGDMTIAGQNMRTTNSIYNYGTGGSFDAFDFAECYPCDTVYPAGAVVCPSETDEHLTLCTHDGCAFAMIVSAGGGFTIGGGEDDKPDTVLPIAVSGRVRVKTDANVARRQWVTSDGRGGVRLAKPTERKAYRLGFALHETNAGEVGIFLRGK